MMGFAIVGFHWRPGDFWSATPHEFWAAHETYVKMNKVED